jgi:trehalose 6-phosphate synthase/phosphatase
VLLVQIAVPSRSHVPEYQRLASLVHEMVGRINGRFGTLGSMPIHHLDRSLTFHELVALYALTDVALVTPVRDGMNLVSYEVVACQSKNAGVLVLSEFAGAAQSLGAGALLVNPWNVSDLAGAIKEALFMGDAERRELHRQNFMHVTVHTSHAWADTFISELNDTHVEAALRTMHTPPLVEPQRVVQAFCESRERLVVVGYNATLVSPPGASGATQQKQKRSSCQVSKREEHSCKRAGG